MKYEIFNKLRSTVTKLLSLWSLLQESKEKENRRLGKKHFRADNQSFTSILRHYCVFIYMCVYTRDVEGELMEEPLPCVFPSGYSLGPEKNQGRVDEGKRVNKREKERDGVFSGEIKILIKYKSTQRTASFFCM